MTSAAQLPKGTVVTADRLAGVPVERVTTAASDPDRVVLHLHGGGYTIGTPAAARGWAAALAHTGGLTVVGPDYRLAPEHPFPAGLDDAEAVWRALVDTGGVDASRIALSGDSAGGGLAVALAARLRDAGDPGPAALVLVSPWLDLTNDRLGDRPLIARDPLLQPPWLAQAAAAYVNGGADLADPAVSPLLGSLAGLRPVLVQAGADDILISDSIAFVAGCRRREVRPGCPSATGSGTTSRSRPECSPPPTAACARSSTSSTS
jgi:acetyl esterase/lipase